jgi:hypothetical protein
MRLTSRRLARRGTTLIEAVAVVLVLALAVPPTISGMMSSASRRADAIQIARATTFAGSVMDQVMCDAVTVDIGASSAAYLDTPTTGLRARLSSTATLYTGMGMSFTVTFGPLVDSTLVTSGVVARDLFRQVIVSVTFVDSTGTSRTIPVTTVISTP